MFQRNPSCRGKVAGLGAHRLQTPMPGHRAVTGFSLPGSERMHLCVCCIERCMCVCVCVCVCVRVASACCGDLGTGRGWPSSLGELHKPGPSCLWSNHRTPIWEHCCCSRIRAERASNRAGLATGLEPKLKGAAEIINSHVPSDSSVLPGGGIIPPAPSPSFSPVSFGEGGLGKKELMPVRRVVLKQTRIRLLNDTRVLGCREQGVCAKRPCQLDPEDTT